MARHAVDLTAQQEIALAWYLRRLAAAEGKSKTADEAVSEFVQRHLAPVADQYDEELRRQFVAALAAAPAGATRETIVQVALAEMAK